MEKHQILFELTMKINSIYFSILNAVNQSGQKNEYLIWLKLKKNPNALQVEIDKFVDIFYRPNDVNRTYYRAVYLNKLLDEGGIRSDLFGSKSFNIMIVMKSIDDFVKSSTLEIDCWEEKYYSLIEKNQINIGVNQENIKNNKKQFLGKV